MKTGPADIIETAKAIAGNPHCARGEFHERVNAIIPYLCELIGYTEQPPLGDSKRIS